MFASRYFANRYFAPRYWPDEQSVGGGEPSPGSGTPVYFHGGMSGGMRG